MKIKNLIISAIATLSVLASCIQELRKDDFKDEAISGLIKINVEMPEGYAQFTTDGMKITLTDNSTGLVYTTTVDADGHAEARVAYGTYSVSAESKFKSGNMIDIFNGVVSGLRVTPDYNSASTTIMLKHSRSSQIIIKEFYYGGCKNLASGKTYQNDKYFILYNNSDEVANLDSLCVGTAYPWNAPTNGRNADFANPQTGELLDGVPCSGIGWMFDGKGKDILLQPGEEVVVALNAIDHTKITANSVNLGVEGYYALYSPIFTPRQSVPEAGTILLNGFWKTGPSNQYVLSVNSPALFIFRMGGGRSIEQFISETYMKNPKTPNSALTHCLFVETENVIDGVECLKSNSDTKRLVSEVDNGFICTPGSAQGYSIHRKIDEEATAAAGGRIVYQDTNNSSNDFYVRDNASLTGK